MRVSVSVLCVLLCVLLDVSRIQANPKYVNANYNDPFAPDDTMLSIWVDTKCPLGITVEVHVPAAGFPDNAQSPPGGSDKFTSNPSSGAPVTSLILTPTPYTSLVADNANFGSPESATVGVSFDGSGNSVWTFTDFKDAYLIPSQVHPTNFDNPGFSFKVDIPSTPFENAGIFVIGQVQIVGNVLANPDIYFTVTENPDKCGNPPCVGCGDPVFSGFQGQVYQFHGLPDEHFNLVSSPDVQLNSHFVYLSSGKCDYNDTECFTHPGTYMDILGMSIADTHVKLVAGTHEAGLRVWVNERELARGARIHALSTNTTAALTYHHNGRVEITTQVMSFVIVNSDMFFNIHAALNDPELLRVGATKHTVTDSNICKTNSETHNHQLVESTVSHKYPVTTPLHGLIGQTWRNVKVCGRDWMGTVQDYVASDLFASDYHYNYFNW